MRNHALIVGTDHAKDPDITTVVICELRRHSRHVIAYCAAANGLEAEAKAYRQALRYIVMKRGRKSQRANLRRLRFEANRAKRRA